MSRIFTLAAVLAFLQLAPTTATAQYSPRRLGARGDLAVGRRCALGVHLRIYRAMPDDHPCGAIAAFVIRIRTMSELRSRGGRVVRVRISRVRSCGEIH